MVERQSPPRLMSSLGIRGAGARQSSSWSSGGRLLALLLGAFAAVSPAYAGADGGATGLSLAERMDAQKAIEEVKWRRRIWPEGNPGAKPGLHDVLPAQALEERVLDGLRKSAALDVYWRRPVTREQLQAEVDRMVRDTRDPLALRELFAALHNDPVLIRECLARPILVERLARSWYSFDDRRHQNSERLAKSGQGESFERLVEYRPGDPREGVRTDGRAELKTGVTWIDPAAWSGFVGRLSRVPEGSVTETADAFVRRQVVAREPELLVVSERFWAKRPFEAWWAETASTLPVSAAIAPPAKESATDGATAPAPAAAPIGVAGACNPDAWLSDAGISGLDPRTQHTAVWTGAEMIVWGGFNGEASESGFAYDPATDVWTRVVVANAPGARSGHTAVWTGTEMIVWGGYLALTDTRLNTGGRYNPLTKTWISTSLTGAPTARDRHTAVWTGTEMIVWGGDAGGPSPTESGARFSPGANTWAALPLSNAPGARWDHTAVWSGAEMIVWGGEDLAGPRSDGKRYNRSGNSWSSMPAAPGDVPARTCHTAVWTGAEMIVWGGNTGLVAPTNTGARYNPNLNSWTTLPGAGAPSARWNHTAVWTGVEMIVWGGAFGSGEYWDGARYTPGVAAWTPMTLGDAPAPRSDHTAVWTGAEMIVWGGESGGLATNTGGRYQLTPEEIWLPTSTRETVPSARWRHTGVWTGAEFVIWGGEDAAFALQTGGRYDPATANWTPTALGGAPLPRTAHTAVWTGAEMIVWGGGSAPNGTVVQYDTGARYSPVLDEWVDLPLLDAPAARAHHRAVWTGTEMIVWGGGDYGTIWRNTGGRYRPASDSWAPTSTGSGVPSGRDSHAAVWTGTEMIVWGGYDGLGDLNTGSRYNPANDAWTPLPLAGAPTSRFDHSAVWTGRELIVWGGFDYDTASTLNTGAHFNPASGTWSPSSTGAGAPEGRARHSSVWSGERMIVWGGSNQDGAAPDGPLSTGGLYDPASKTWAATSVGANAPAGRQMHTAIWAGSRDGRMFLWGGSPGAATGGIYCGLSCTASPPSGASVLRVTKGLAGEAQVSWTTLTGATGHDVVRGEIGALLSSAGDFARATSRCLSNNTSATTTSDSLAPGDGKGFWYLQRGRNCGGAGTYDSGALPAELRDSGIESSGSACP